MLKKIPQRQQRSSTFLCVLLFSTSAFATPSIRRSIINTRRAPPTHAPTHGRKLPCPNKCGGSSSNSNNNNNNNNVNCVGSWSQFSSCVPSTGQQTRTYTHTTNRAGSGTACPHSNNYQQSISCDVNCAGTFSAYSACNEATGLKSRDYSITTAKQHGGNDCSHAHGATQEQTCAVDCQVSASAWSACVSGLRSRTWTVGVQARNAGATCSSAGGGVPSNIMNQNGATATQQDSTCTDPNQPCAGAWSEYGTCDPSTSTRLRTYSVTQVKAGTGASCPVADGNTETEACNPDQDCIGSWGEWGTCGSGQGVDIGEQQRMYSVTQAASGSGSSTTCTHADSIKEIKSCPIKVIDWNYYVQKSQWNTHLLQQKPLPNATEMTMVTCPVGKIVRLQWENTENTHDVWELPGDVEFNQCDFEARGATRLFDVGAKTGHVDITCAETVGARYFSCSMGDACSKGLQKIRLHTTDPSKTATLRSTEYIDAVTGNTRTHSSLAQVFEEYLITLTYNGHTLQSDAEADEILAQLDSIVDNAPESCSDWLANPTEKICQAFAYTDMGFIQRVRPTPDFGVADKHYARAVELGTGTGVGCAAQSYRTELMLAQVTPKHIIDEQYKKVCDACGGSGSGMSIVQLAFAHAGVSMAEMPKCSSSGGSGSGGNVGSTRNGPTVAVATTAGGNNDNSTTNELLGNGISMVGGGVSATRMLLLLGLWAWLNT